MQKSYLIAVVFIVFSCSLSGQYKAQVLGSVELQATKFVGVDAFDNSYYIKKTVFYKKSGTQTIQFADFTLGTPTSVDLLNPLKIVVFYQSANTAVILDNTLNEISRLDFNSLEQPRLVQFATGAGERKLWIHNQELMQLELWDTERNVLLAAGPPISRPVEYWATDYNNAWVVAGDELLHYNNYGTLLSSSTIGNTQGIAAGRGTLIAYVDNKWLYKPKESGTFVVLDIFKEGAHHFSLTGNILYIYDGSSVTSYRIMTTN